MWVKCKKDQHTLLDQVHYLSFLVCQDIYCFPFAFSEFLVDLMAAPGTLIPADIFSGKDSSLKPNIPKSSQLTGVQSAKDFSLPSRLVTNNNINGAKQSEIMAPQQNHVMFPLMTYTNFC